MSQATCPNGASLQDCHTNFFALADLSGIKWRRMRAADHQINIGSSSQKDAIDDPVLSSYGKCMGAGELLCAWTRVERPAPDSGQPSPAATSAGACFTKELWLFWYSKNPDFTDLLSNQLHEVEQGCWDTGLTYECRTVLFKAFHNLIERNLLTKGFARFGKWFTQPALAPASAAAPTSRKNTSGTPLLPADSSSSPTTSGTSCSSTSGGGNRQLSFSFDFFVHGDSTVCASVDVRYHPVVYRLHKHLLTVAQNTQSGVEVMLSPYGLAATLTGQSLKENDPLVQKFLTDWKKFYPLTVSSSSPSSSYSHSSSSTSSKDGSCSSSTSSKQLPIHLQPFSTDSHEADSSRNRMQSSLSGFPAVVEVVVNGVKMKYPSSYCFYSTDPVEPQLQTRGSSSRSGTSNTSNGVTISDTSGPATESCPYLPTGRQPLDSLLTPPSSPPNPDTQIQTKLITPVMSQHQPTKPSLTSVLRSLTEHKIVMKCKNENQRQGSEELVQDPLWPYVDPASRVSCNCIRCRSPKKNCPVSTKSSSQAVGTGAMGKKEKERVKKNPAFHKRNLGSWITSNDCSDTTKQQPCGASQPLNQSQAPSSVASNQPKTPSHSYKSPAPGGLPSLQSNATTPGCIDSPRSSNLMNGDGPESVSAASMGLPSVSPHPSKDQSDSQSDAAVAPSPVVNSVTKEKSQLEQLLSPFPTNNLAKESSMSAAINGHFPWTVQNSNINEQNDMSSENSVRPIDSDPLKRPQLAENLDEDRSGGRNLLYDFSLFTDDSLGWDLPHAKRRRKLPLAPHDTDENSVCQVELSAGSRDPYEFKDGFDEEQHFTKQNSTKQLQNHQEVAFQSSAKLLSKSSDETVPWSSTANNNNNSTAFSMTKEQKCITNGLSSIFAPSPLTPNSQFMLNAGDLQPSYQDLDNMFEPSSGEDSCDGDNHLQQQQQNTCFTRKKSQSSSALVAASADLSTMFPTPPSHETAAASPSTLALEATLSNEDVPCSPAFIERLHSSDIVYKPPVTCKIIASRKYAPVANITTPSEIPIERRYRVSNSSSRSHQLQQQHQNVLATENQLTICSQSVTPFPRSSGYQHQQVSPGPAYGPRGGPFSQPMHPNSPFASRAMLPVRSPVGYGQSQQMSVSPLHGALQGALAGALTGKSPYSDLSGQMMPYGSSPMTRAPRPGNPHAMNSMFDGIVSTDQMGFRNALSSATVPEVNAVLVNLILSDSLLNLFKDHNFDSCTICVCNMDIKGSDAGIYLPESLMSGADEPQYKCTCGFSAVVNRRKSPFSGLFYEDEVEVTGLKYEPIERFNRIRASCCDADGVMTRSTMGLFGAQLTSEISSTTSLLLDLIRSQCSYIMSRSSLLSRYLLTECRSPISDSPAGTFAEKVTTFRSDCSEVISMALTSGTAMLEAFPKLNILQNRRTTMENNCLHDWQFSAAQVPVNNHDVVRFLRFLQPILQESVQKKPKAAAMWEVTYSVSGPLTWRQFHKLASRTEDQCEPQPIPSLLVGQNREWVGTAPFSLKMWEHLFYEPFSSTRDVAYLVLTPDHPFILPKVKSFFRELTVAYESLRFGRHVAMNKILPDGIVKVNKSAASKLADEKIEDQWFSEVSDPFIGSRLKLYAQVCTGYLVPLIRETSQASLLELFKEPKQPSSSSHPMKSANPNTSAGVMGHSINTSGFSESTSSDLKMEESGDPNLSTNFNSQLQEEAEDESNRQPVIVVYIIDPFCSSQLDAESYKTACVGLLRCFTQVYKSLPEQQSSLNLQIISMQSILEGALDVDGSIRQEQMKSLALSVYGQCRKTVNPSPLCKSLTGFGPSASLEQFLKTFSAQGLIPHCNRFFCPPFILAPLKDKQTELGEMFGERREKSMTLYCSYCLTEDQRWIVASCSNEKGDILETTVINIEVQNRNRRKGVTVRKFGLNKLMEFFVSVMSEALEPWRLVIGRVGRLGHGEMREWASLLSKKALIKTTARLKEKCDLCKELNYFEQPSILSACLISLEPDTALRVFPDQVTTEDRFSNRSNSCSLTTPEDASSTHLLVFPTSATISSSQGNFQNDPSNLGDDDLLGALGVSGCDDDLGVDDGMNDLFNWNEDLPSPGLQGGDQQGMSHADGDGARHSGFDSNGLRDHSGLNDMSDEPLQLLQQPLALGYYVSTAQTGPLPRSFWSSCPHLQDVTPVFLKAALLIHTPSVHQHTDELMHQNNKNGHPLDSHLTTDVLRYVLEGYNSLSWLALDPATHDRSSCLPIHIQLLMQLYSTIQALT